MVPCLRSEPVYSNNKGDKAQQLRFNRELTGLLYLGEPLF